MKEINYKNKLGSLNLNEFHNPSTEYRGVPLWFLNDKLDVSEAINQLKNMRFNGWGRVILRKYSGLYEAPYEKSWNEVLNAVLKECEKLDMKVFLQEGNVPFSGIKPEYGHKMLVRRKLDETPDKNETLILKNNKYAYYQHLALDPVKTTAFRRVDTLDPNAMENYLESIFNYLYTNFGYGFGKTIDAVWVDEPEARNADELPPDSVPWTTILPDVFVKEWGYSLIDNIPALFEEVDDFQKIRHHYWRTVCRMFTDGYWKKMGEYCEKYKLKFSGHQYGEDSFSRQLHHTINCMPHYEYMQRPGIDFLTGDLTWPCGDPFIMPPKQASSVAHQLGKEEVLCEMYGVSDQGTSFEDRKWIFNWLSVLGINYRCYHGAFYSLRGERKRIWPMTLNYQQPWWNYNRFIADYAARICYVLRQGKFKADILLVNPIESYYLNPKLESSEPVTTSPLDKDFITLSHNLLKIQKSYDYSDESLIFKYGKVNKNVISIGEMDYKIVILPSIYTLRKSTVSILEEFINNGGTVISVGDLPNRIDGELSDEINKFNQRLIRIKNEPQELDLELSKLYTQWIKINSINNLPTETIWLQEREFDNGKMFFLTNINKEQNIETEIFIDGNGKLEYLNLESGKKEEISQQKNGNYITTKLQFAPSSAHLLFLNEELKQENIPEILTSKEWQIPINTYTIERHTPNSLTIDFCRYKKIDQQWSELLPIIGITEKLNSEKYNGPISLQYEFDIEKKPKYCIVVVENASEHEILINGNEVKYLGLPYYLDKSFYPINITNFIKTGKNIIQTSCNYTPADSSFADDKRAYGTELEQIYLIGDFIVKSKKISEDFFECVRYKYDRHFTISDETFKTTGDLLADGYCFFCGTISLISTAIIPKINNNDRVYIEIGKLNATVSNIKINNEVAGNIIWPPYKHDITDYIWEGENKIEICLTNSLRNLLGTFHYIPVPVSNPWPVCKSPEEYDGPDWLEKRKKGVIKSWSDDYFFRPIGVKDVSIKCEKRII